MFEFIYPIQRNSPINNPGFKYSFVGIPPEIRNKIDAIKYLRNTTVVGDKSSSKFFTIIKVDPNNKAARTKALTAISFLFLNIWISEH